MSSVVVGITSSSSRGRVGFYIAECADLLSFFYSSFLPSFSPIFNTSLPAPYDFFFPSCVVQDLWIVVGS